MGIKSKLLVLLFSFLVIFSFWTVRVVMPSISPSGKVSHMANKIVEFSRDSVKVTPPTVNLVDAAVSQEVVQSQVVQSLPNTEIPKVETIPPTVSVTTQKRTFYFHFVIILAEASDADNTSKLNSYELSLLEKEKKREAFLEKYVAEQTELMLYPSSSPKFVIIHPVTSGIGNNLAILAEGILMSALTRRRLLSKIQCLIQCSL